MIDPEAPLTKKQSWAIFTCTGYDCRDSNLTKEEAHDIISAFKGDDSFDRDELIKIIEESGGTLKKKVAPKQDLTKLFAEACHAGELAAAECVPTPMHVVERANPLDDNSEIIKRYEPIADGVCGFASIIIRPGNHRFVNLLKKMETDLRNFGLYGGKHYRGGYSLSVMSFNQSYEKKRAYAGAFARVLTDEFHGDPKFMAYCESRLD